MLLLLVASYFAPDLSRLGADEWEVREREQARCDNLLLPLFLPTHHDDPEVNYRVRALRVKNLKWLDAVYAERAVKRYDFAAWAELYLFTGRSLLAREFDTFAEIHGEHQKADAVFRRWPAFMAGMGEGFLRGSFQPGEYEKYLEFLDYHLRTAPMPSEVVPDPMPAP